MQLRPWPPAPGQPDPRSAAPGPRRTRPERHHVLVPPVPLEQRGDLLGPPDQAVDRGDAQGQEAAGDVGGEQQTLLVADLRGKESGG